MKDRRRIALIVGVVLLLGTLAGPATAQYITKVYLGDQGDSLVVQSGGKIVGTPGATVVLPRVKVLIPTTVGTATPENVIDNYGKGWSLEIKKKGTTVAGVDADGNITSAGVDGGAINGDTTITGTLTTTGGITATTGGVTASAGGLKATAGGLTVSAGGAAITGDTTVTGGITATTGITVSAGGATITAGGLTVSAGGATIAAGGVTLTEGDSQVNDFYIADVQGALTLTDNGVITPTGTYQPITEAGDVTVTIKSTGYVTGTLLVLINTAEQTVVITDTASYSAPSLGQYDTASFIWDGTQWVQIGEVDN